MLKPLSAGSGPTPTLLFALLSALGLSTLGLACSGDDPINNGNSRPGNGVFLDAGADLEEEEGGQPAACPASVPRSGETCPTVTLANTRCSYVIRQCTSQGMAYDVTEDYCCSRGSVWEPCGMVQPCEEPPPAEPDAGAADAAE